MCSLTNKQIFIIKRFSEQDGNLFIHGQVLKNLNDFFDAPLRSGSDLGIYEGCVVEDDIETTFAADEILYKYIYLPLEDRFVFMPFSSQLF